MCFDVPFVCFVDLNGIPFSQILLRLHFVAFVLLCPLTYPFTSFHHFLHPFIHSHIPCLLFLRFALCAILGLELWNARCNSACWRALGICQGRSAASSEE